MREWRNRITTPGKACVPAGAHHAPTRKLSCCVLCVVPPLESLYILNLNLRIARKVPTETLAANEHLATDIPARLDRLPWSRWHTRVTAALGITWLLDGLEGGIGGSLSGALKLHETLALTDAQLGLSSSFYLAGNVVGALTFGYLADRFGRRKLFFWTLLLYVTATALSGFSWSLVSFTLCRFLTGAGIGGEYAAVTSAVDELIPARLRGRVDLLINSTFWLGVMLGSLVSVAFLSPALFGVVRGWRVAFLAGLPIAAVVLAMRRHLPESPRWLLSHNREPEAEAILTAIESEVRNQTGQLPEACAPVTIPINTGASFGTVLRLFTGPYRARAWLCMGIMVAQSFFYNSVFFSITLILLRFYGVTATRVGYLFLPIAFTNFLGPALMGHLFDSIGRRTMMAFTFSLAGVTLFVASLLFLHGGLTMVAQVALWSLCFFFAAAAAGSAYLTTSELFPQSIRATAIAFFYGFGTLFGGVAGPFVFGYLLNRGQRGPLFWGFTAAALGMVIAGAAQAVWGVAAERQPLEALASLE